MISIPSYISLELTPYKHYLSEYYIDDSLKKNIHYWLLNEAQWNNVKASLYTQ